jgi:hypothetical protein
MQMHVGPGSLSGALGILGTALAVLFPEQRWIGGLLVLVAVVVFVFDVRIEGWHIEVSQLESTKILPQLLMGLGALGFIAGAVWYFNVPKTQPTAGAPITDMERSRRNITLMMIREKYIKEHTSAPPEQGLRTRHRNGSIKNCAREVKLGKFHSLLNAHSILEFSCSANLSAPP